MISVINFSFSFGVVKFMLVAEFIVISWRVFRNCVAKSNFLFCHPSSSLRTKKISACAQGGPGGEVGKALSCQLEDAGSIPAELNTSIPSV